MSADAYSDCPKCLDRAEKEVEARKQAAIDQYGKVSLEEYKKIQRAASFAYGDFMDEIDWKYSTFVEQYEIYGSRTGTLTIFYSGSCNKCGLKLEFKEEKLLYSKEEEKSTNVT